MPPPRMRGGRVRACAHPEILLRVFHVELRKFPHVTHAFNLTADELDHRIVRPWLRGLPVEWGERQWLPGQAKITIYEGARLRPEDVGMGRGWQNAKRGAKNVTEDILAAADSLSPLKEAILATVPIEISAVVMLANERFPERRVSERLALAEQAVWELLHLGKLSITRDGDQVPMGEWEGVMLAWSSWAGSGGLILGIPPAV